VLDSIEGQGQVLGYYVEKLRERGHGTALCVLPHDGMNANSLTGKRYEEHLKDAGFEVKVVENQGRGAAMMRVEAARRLFPRIWFHEETTADGREALGAYHARIDTHRFADMGPEHDWSSHGADAFGLMAVDYEAPRAAIARDDRRYGHGRGQRSVWA
jgi:phage terminase large subunit